MNKVTSSLTGLNWVAFLFKNNNTLAWLNRNLPNLRSASSFKWVSECSLLKYILKILTRLSDLKRSVKSLYLCCLTLISLDTFVPSYLKYVEREICCNTQLTVVKYCLSLSALAWKLKGNPGLVNLSMVGNF